MTLATFNEMVRLCLSYDAFTSHIDSYTIQSEAEKRNRVRDDRFNQIMQAEGWKGYNRGIPEKFTKASVRSLEKELREWVWERDWTIEDDDMTERDGVHGVIRNYGEAETFIPIWAD